MSVSKRPDTGKWKARYRDGTGRQHAKDFRTKAEAEEWVSEQERRVRRNEWTDPSAARITVATMRDEWRATLTVKPKTLAGYDELWVSQVEPRWGSVRLHHVRPLDIQTWVAGMTGRTGQPLSPSRRRQAFFVLRSILDAAVMDNRLGRNPAASVTLPRIPKASGGVALKPAQVEALAAACGDHAQFVRFLSYSGARFGEAAALRVRDLDPLRNTVKINRSVSDVNGSMVETTTKTHQGRILDLPAPLVTGLVEHFKGRGPGDLLFPDSVGGYLRPSNFHRDVWKPALRATGLDLRVHDLRHVAASLAISTGATVLQVQRMLGHSTARLTLDTYGHLLEGGMRDLAHRMADLMRSDETGLRPESVAN